MLREEFIAKRRQDDSESVILAWLNSQPDDEWGGTAAELAEELAIVNEAAWPARHESKAWVIPQAVGITRFLEAVDEAIFVAGWIWDHTRTASGRKITFARRDVG